MDKQVRANCLSKSFYYYIAENDVDKARHVAHELLKIKPRNRPLLEDLAAFFIDEECEQDAESVMNFLVNTFKFNKNWYVLRARIAELSGDYNSVIEYSQKGIKADLATWQKAVLYNILGKVYTDLGDINMAGKCYLTSSNLPHNPGRLLDYSNYLFTMHYRNYTQEKMYQAISEYDNIIGNIRQYEHLHDHVHKRLRIGYISPDFRRHVMAFFSYAMLKDYDRAYFSVYVYANCKEDIVSAELATDVDVWRNIYGLSAKDAAQRIYDDEIDVLVDLSGHTANNCLPIMAYKPAPVQISGIGWFDSTGLKSIDYYITDNYLSPDKECEKYFCEKLLRMSNSHFCYMWHGNPSVPSLPPMTRNKYITFGSLNNIAKISDEVLYVWSVILKKIPTAKLFIKGKALGKKMPYEELKRRMQALNFDLTRIVFEGYSDDYLLAYTDIDIALDTFPYPGGGTTCDALYMGVPVITLTGKNHGARFGYSILKNLHLDELCAYTIEEYIDIAYRLAEDRNKLCHYRNTLRRRMQQSPLMDSAAYMMELEQNYIYISKKKISGYTLTYLYSLETQERWIELICKAREALVYFANDQERACAWALLGEAYLSAGEYISAQRAVYALKKALSCNELPQRIRWLCFLTEAAQRTDDFVLRYEAAHEAAQLAVSDSKADIPAEWLWNIHSYCAHAALDLGYYEEAEREYMLAMKTCQDYERKTAIVSSYLLTCHYQDYSTVEICERQKIYAEIAGAIPKMAVNHTSSASDKIRIGYLSPDFRKHAMFPVFYAMLAYYNKNQFSVICYQLNEKTDEYTEHLKMLVDEWYVLAGMTYKDIAQKIHENRIDILVDLASHSRGTGLPALMYRPAPVQISGLGSLCTTGLSEVDYYITDGVVDPPETHEKYFVEKPLYLPAQFSYTGPANVPDTAGTPACHREYILLGCFQEYRKITDAMLLTWQKILKALPMAKLLIKSIPFASASLADAAYERMRKLGMPMEQVILELGDAQYMTRLLDVDIMLDTYPYTGGRTTLDALYMGVPVVTLYGERRNTRFGYSILHSVGLDELAADTREQYIENVLTLANNLDVLDALHRQLRERLLNSETASPIKYIKFLEEKYLEILKKDEK